MQVRATITEHERLRRRGGFSVTGFAEAMGCSHSYVSQVEGGTKKPSVWYQQSAARVLRVPVELLFGEQ